MSLAQAAVTQFDVVRALMVRDSRTEYADSRFGYLLALWDPLLWVLLFYFAFTLGGRGDGTVHGMGVLPFLATGVCTYKMFQKITGSVTPKVPRNMLALPRVTLLDTFLAKAGLSAATMVLVFLVLVGGASLLEGSLPRVDDPLLVVWGMALAVVLGFGLSLVLGSLTRLSKAAGASRTLIIRPLFWTSGMFFVVEDLPSTAREIFLYNPVLHAVELVRGGWFLSYRALYADSQYALAFALVLLWFGLQLERMTRHRSK